MSDNPQAAQPSDAGDTAFDPADKLAALTEQIGRLESELACAADAPRDRLESLVTDFEEQRESWELHRQQEMGRFRQEGVALTDAWQRLEDEQRRLFAERERLRCGVPLTSAGGRTAGSATAAAPNRGADSGSRQQPAADRHTAPTGTTWWQLEQLRLEIQKHARREA